MLEVEAASMNAEATARLAKIKEQLGIGPAAVADDIPEISAAEKQEAKPDGASA
jgi:hypothetical protein